jgi:hypothetical protein
VKQLSWVVFPMALISVAGDLIANYVLEWESVWARIFFAPVLGFAGLLALALGLQIVLRMVASACSIWAVLVPRKKPEKF